MENKIGSWITLNNPAIAEIMADAGFDWLCIDMEHSVIDFYEAKQLIIAIQSKGIKAFVRVGGNNSRIIKRILDAGADGIIVPSVNSLEEAKAVNAFKYPPKGQRGVGLSRAQGYGFSFENYRDNICKDLILILQIEHISALDDLESIIKLEGVDGTFIGPYDLSGSIGKPGEWNDPKVKEALALYKEIAFKTKKLVGYHVIEPEHLLVQKINEGYNFIAFSLDTIFLGSLLREEMKKIKKMEMNIIGIIPARLASSRLPNKPMAEILGMPMIGHVYFRSKMSKILKDIYVATCDDKIKDYIESIGGKVIMTSHKHERA